MLLSEGVQKFLFPDQVGLGRFTKIGFSNPEFMSHFVAVHEIAFGVLLLLGLFTRLSVVPIIVIMLSALYFTKIPILLNSGFWQMAHAARTDLSMLICSIVLLIEGSGVYSLDNWLKARFGVKNK